EPEEVGPVRDDQLRMIFTCCHPALSPLAQTALTLRLLGGLEVPEIARAYLVPEATIAQRIVRAKKKIRDAAIPYRVPEASERPDLVRRCLRRDRPGPYQLQAAINAVHTDGPATDWSQVLALYDQLLRHTPTPIVALNRAVAVAEVHGPAAALAAIEDLDLPG